MECRIELGNTHFEQADPRVRLSQVIRHNDQKSDKVLDVIIAIVGLPIFMVAFYLWFMMIRHFIGSLINFNWKRWWELLIPVYIVDLSLPFNLVQPTGKIVSEEFPANFPFCLMR